MARFYTPEKLSEHIGETPEGYYYGSNTKTGFKRDKWISFFQGRILVQEKMEVINE